MIQFDNWNVWIDWDSWLCLPKYNFLSFWIDILRGFQTLSFEISKASNEICPLECYCYWVSKPSSCILGWWLSHRHAFLVGVHVCFEKGEDIRYYFSCSPEISSSISVSEHLKLWNFPFSWTHATPILDCKPTWPFLQEKCDTIGQHANKRPLGMDSAFTWVHDILTTVNTNSFGINYIIPYFAKFLTIYLLLVWKF